MFVFFLCFVIIFFFFFFFFSSRRRHTRWPRDWSSDVCSSDLRLCRAVFSHARPGLVEIDGRWVEDLERSSRGGVSGASAVSKAIDVIAAIARESGAGEGVQIADRDRRGREVIEMGRQK